MTLKIVPYKAGVIKDDTAYNAEGYSLDTDKIRWVRGKAQWQGGWELATQDTFSGICRGLHSWANVNGNAHIAIGTNEALYTVGGGAMFNITPIASSGTFSSNPFSVTSGSTTISVSHSANGVATGDVVLISGATAVGGITPGGPSGTFSNAFYTTSGSTTVLVALSSHGMHSGDAVTVSTASTVGGIVVSGYYQIYVLSSDVFMIDTYSSATATASGGGVPAYEFWRAYELTAVDAATYTISSASAATSTATGGGSGAKFLYRLAKGQESGLAGLGYGTNYYGDGPYGTALAAAARIQPRTWSLSHFGQNLIANPLAGGIYQWDLNFSQPAAILSNAPATVLVSLVTPERAVMAFGCTSLAGTFTPMLVRWSDIEDANDWTPATDNLAGSLLLAEGSQIVAVKSTKGGILCWTDTALYVITYTGDPDSVYQASLLGTGCGCLGPNAAIDHDGSAFWISQALQFYAYTGGSPRPLVNPNRMWFQSNLAAGQGYKVYADFDSAFTGIKWMFPDTTTNECTLYLRYDPLETASDPKAGWSNGTWDRTAWIDRGIVPRPLATSATGYLYFQEQGYGDNGNAVSRFIEFAGIDLSNQEEDGARVLNLRRAVMDAITTNGFNFQLYLWRWYNGTQTTLPSASTSYTWTNSTEYKDIQAQGRIIGLYISTDGAGDYLRLGDLRLDLSPGPYR